MGRDKHYVPGSFYRVDDRTGFPTRSYRTRKEWNDISLFPSAWYGKRVSLAQDFVKGR